VDNPDGQLCGQLLGGREVEVLGNTHPKALAGKNLQTL